MDRRTLLKQLFLGSGLALSSNLLSPATQGVAQCSGPNDPNASYTNILLHGLFFMELRSDSILIITPIVGGHQYFCGVGGLLMPLPRGEVNWTKALPVQAKPVRDFPSQVPQFSKNDTGVGGLDDNAPFYVKITLPVPSDIVGLRRDALSHFVPLPSRHVGDNILSRCSAGGSNSEMAMVTCLNYVRTSAGPNINYNLYAEHPDVPATWEVNKALTDSQTLFQQPDAFDLLMKATSNTVVKPTPNACYGVTAEDQYSLMEKTTPHRGINVTNCIQFGLT